MNLFNDDFVSNIDIALFQDEHQLRLRCGVLKFFILSISRQLTLKFRFHLISSNSWQSDEDYGNSAGAIGSKSTIPIREGR
jgi:hypothetical protein